MTAETEETMTIEIYSGETRIYQTGDSDEAAMLASDPEVPALKIFVHGASWWQRRDWEELAHALGTEVVVAPNGALWIIDP